MKDNEKLSKLRVLCGSAKKHLSCSTVLSQSYWTQLDWADKHRVVQVSQTLAVKRGKLAPPMHSNYSGLKMQIPAFKIQLRRMTDLGTDWLGSSELTTNTTRCVFKFVKCKSKRTFLHLSGLQNSLVKPAWYFSSGKFLFFSFKAKIQEQIQFFFLNTLK